VKLRVALLAFAAFGCTAQQRFPLETITTEGISIPPATLSTLTGLKPGDSVDDASFQAASKKLQETGLFAEVGFRFTPGPKKLGYSLILTLKDHPQKMNAVFEFPGKTEEPIWACVKQQLPWLSNPLPAAGAAQDYLAQVVGKCVGGGTPVIAQSENDLARHKVELVFRPRELPRVSALQFSGVQKVTPKALEQSLTTAAIDSEFSERRFRNLLELNARPFYETYGILNVRFTAVAFAPADAGHVAVTTTIEEGFIYKLAEVQIEGTDLPPDVAQAQAKFKRGQVAAWPEILKSIEELEKPLLKTGYIRVHSTTARKLDDSAASLALTVRVDKGRQYFFNSLNCDGVPLGLQERVRKMWKLQGGSPMDQPYMIEYLKSLLQQSDLKGMKIGVSMRPAADDKMDVVVTIR
jgi:outer membrane protein assembly factor BamA